ncbi:MAG: hypothetical protein U0L11_03895 [Acutalibacteraceae bacterium]|nr:hypothetical protein [Acutalibacteraceae bacterium]
MSKFFADVNVDGDELERIISFCIELGLPVTFKELGITEVTDEKLMAVSFTGIGGIQAQSSFRGGLELNL